MSQKMMKAVRFFDYGEPSVLKYMDFPMPEVGDNDVLIKVKATSINRFDLKMRRGQIPQIPGRDPFPMPFQPGRDAAGEVEAVGKNVNRFKSGDRVVCMVHPACGQCENCLKDMDNLCTNIRYPGHQTPGGYAEYISRPENGVLHAPEGITYEKLACTIWAYSCVWNVISRRGELRTGQTVLIHGASGGLGTAAIQLCKMVGASKIIATTGSPSKIEKLKGMGVDEVVNYRDEDVIDQIKSLTGGIGVDLVMDFVGGDMFILGCKSLRLNGTIVNVAGEESKSSISLRDLSVLLMHRHLKMVGVRGSKRMDNIQVVKFLEEKKIDPPIDKIMPLSEAVKAHELLESQDQFGKIVLIP